MVQLISAGVGAVVWPVFRLKKASTKAENELPGLYLQPLAGGVRKRGLDKTMAAWPHDYGNAWAFKNKGGFMTNERTGALPGSISANLPVAAGGKEGDFLHDLTGTTSVASRVVPQTTAGGLT
jgi:hypothetical protein